MSDGKENYVEFIDLRHMRIYKHKNDIIWRMVREKYGYCGRYCRICNCGIVTVACNNVKLRKFKQRKKPPLFWAVIRSKYMYI